jgi:putative chitinase
MDINTLMAATGAKAQDAAKFVDIIDDVLEEFEINTPMRMAAFLSQVAHESGHLHYLKEIWGPTPTQSRYEGRADLGNDEPNDGKKFMGRGLLQVTGKANYCKVGDQLGIDLIDYPEQLEQPEYALKSACLYWNDHNLNTLADAGDIKTITRRINGGYNGLAERTALYSKALTVLS